MAGAAAATAIAAVTGFAALLLDEALMPTVLGAALPTAHAATVAAHAATVAAHAVIPAVREDTAVVLVEATAAAVMLAALAVAAVMLAVAAVVAMLAVAADMAAADIGKLLRLSSKRLACFGRRAFFCGLKIQSKGRTASTADYCGRTSMPVTVA
jgi:hypothetical protein